MKNRPILKPILLGLLSLVTFFAFAKQEKIIQIFKDGQVIQEYSISEIDYIEVNDLIPAPENVVASVSNHQITLKWNPIEGASSYNVYRSPDNVNFVLLASDIKESSYSDSNPLRGSNFYRVKAVVGEIESGWTSSVAATLANSEMGNGIYLGIIGFNQSIYNYPVLRLNESTIEGFHDFIDQLTMKNGTLLYYSVDQALNTLQSTELPSDITTVAIVTFTDGLDQGSMMKDVPYDDDMAYLDALNDRIKNETVSGQPITAYSIGIRGKDVDDINMFQTNLTKLASVPENATEVTSMSEVNAKFQEIAGQLSQSNYIQTINLKMPGVSNGTLVRFTFDNVNSADKSQLYIEGKFNLKERSLEEVRYVGLTSISGSTIKGAVDDIFVSFTFEGIHTDSNILIKSEFTDEWTYRTTSATWQINSEFDKEENSDIVTQKSSAVIMLVLDCSKSLADDFVKAQANAKEFINTLYRAVGGSENPGTNESIYSTIPQDMRAAVWIDGQRYFLTEEEFNSANLSNAYIEGLVVLYPNGYYIISPKNLQSGVVQYDLGLKYYGTILPDLDILNCIPYYLTSLNGNLSRFNFNWIGSTGAQHSDTYLTAAYDSEGKNYYLETHYAFGPIWTGTSYSYSSMTGYVRGMKHMGDERIEWSKPNHLSVVVKNNGKREFIKYEENLDWTSYDIEGVAIDIKDQQFVVLKDDAISENIHKDIALDYYSDILPTAEQAEVINMLWSDINIILSQIGGTTLYGPYFTKTMYADNGVETSDLVTFNCGIYHGYSAIVRGVKLL